MGLAGGCQFSRRFLWIRSGSPLLRVLFDPIISALRIGFRFGFLAGLLVFAPHLFWFWKIFGPAAVCLWAVLAFFTGLFVLTLALWRQRFGCGSLWLVAPLFWTGTEFFRGELYFLKFSWLAPGYLMLGTSTHPLLGWLGIYGCSFVLFLLAAPPVALRGRWKPISLLFGFVILTVLLYFPCRTARAPGKTVHVAGIQLEFPAALELPDYLDTVLAHYPQTDLLLLSEYTFDGEVPHPIRQWCQKHHKYLVAGGKDFTGANQFYNTAFVIGPQGQMVFKQGKSVPIQFFNDGLPASRQELWNSPWGKIALCICYDLSYRLVMDRYVQQGAQAIIVPFMDVAEWGAYQHELHAIVAPVRAREYQLPIFRVGSSGISQCLDANGKLLDSAPFPEQGALITGDLLLASPGRLPFDHWLGPTCSIATMVFLLFGILSVLKQRLSYHLSARSSSPQSIVGN
jgi:apolipoprotein N-acyltransferase